MLSHLQSIIADFETVPKRLQEIVCQYIMFLMLVHKKYDTQKNYQMKIHQNNQLELAN